jgi:hypothetical protein
MAAISPLCRPLGGPGGFVAGGSYGYDSIISSYSKKTDKIVFEFDTTVAVTSADLKLSPSRREATAGVSGNSLRGYWAGGYAERFVSVIDKIYYSIERTATSCPVVLTDGTHGACGVSQGDYKGFIAGGYRKTGTVTTEKTYKIKYATSETLSSVTTANLYEPMSYMASISNNLYKGYFSGGINEVVRYGTIQVISYSNDTIFLLSSKNLGRVVSELAGLDGDNTKGYFGGGDTSSYASSDIIDKFDFATETVTASTSSTYKLSQARTGLAGVSERVKKGYFMGGSSGILNEVGTCDKVTFATDIVEATLSGNLTQARTYVAGVSKVVRPAMSGPGAYFTGGYRSDTPTVLTEKIVYQDDISYYLAPANLLIRRSFAASCSESEYYGYIVSGNLATFGNTSLTNTAEFIDYETDTASFLGGKTIGQSRLALCGCSGSTDNGYFAGGETNIYSTRVDKFSYTTNVFSQVTSANLTPGRTYLAAISDGITNGYFAGGMGASSAANTINQFTYATDSFNTSVTPTLTAGSRWGLSGCDGDALNGYFCGGVLAGNLTTTIEVFSFTSASVTGSTSPGLSTARYQTAAATDGSTKGYVSGGATSRYDPSSMVSTTDKIIYNNNGTSQAISTAALTYARSGLTGVSGIRNASTPKVCGVQALSGGEGTTKNIYTYNISAGLIDFTWNAYAVPDRFIITGGTTTLFDTGSVSGVGKVTILKPEGITAVVVTVIGPSGTGWEYTIGCLHGNIYVAGYTATINVIDFRPVPVGTFGNDFYTFLYSDVSETGGYGIDVNSNLRSNYFGILNTQYVPASYGSSSLLDPPVWQTISNGPPNNGYILNAVGIRSIPLGASNLLYVAGKNSFGELGVGTKSPVTGTFISAGTGSGWTYAKTGFNRSYACKNNQLYATGLNSYLKFLGIGSDNYDGVLTWTATNISTGCKQIVVCTYGTYVIDNSNNLYFTGDTVSESCPLNVTPSVVGLAVPAKSFIQVGSSKWKKIACSGTERCTLGIDINGTLWACGYNANYNFGNNTLTDSIRNFTQVSTDTDWIDISTSGSSSFALKSNGDIYLAGYFGSPTIILKTWTKVNSPVKFFKLSEYPGYALATWSGKTSMSMSESQPLPAFNLSEHQTKESVRFDNSDRKLLCKHASKTPLQMVNSYHGEVAVRKCDIYGMCCHSANLPEREGVFSCQECKDYMPPEQEKNIVFIEQNKEQVFAVVELETLQENQNKTMSQEVKYRNIEFKDENSVQEVEYKDLTEISNENLKDMNGFKIKPKDDIQPDINELLGE